MQQRRGRGFAGRLLLPLPVAAARCASGSCRASRGCWKQEAQRRRHGNGVEGRSRPNYLVRTLRLRRPGGRRGRVAFETFAREAFSSWHTPMRLCPITRTYTRAHGEPGARSSAESVLCASSRNDQTLPWPMPPTLPYVVPRLQRHSVGDRVPRSRSAIGALGCC